MTTPPFDWTEFEAEIEDPARHIAFDPVPRLRARRRGWTEARQRAFIFTVALRQRCLCCPRRRKLKQDFAELDRLAEEERRRKDQVWAEHQAILDRIELERLLKPRPVPRIVRL